MRRMFPVVLATLWALPAASQSLEVIETQDHGAWRSATMLNTETDKRFCAAETLSVFDQVLRLVLYEDGDAFLEILDVTWEYLNGDPVKFNAIVDSEARVTFGQGWDGAITSDLVDDGIRGALLGRLSGGERLDIRLPNRSRVAQFSLDGAADAIAATEDCWAALRAQD